MDTKNNNKNDKLKMILIVLLISVGLIVGLSLLLQLYAKRHEISSKVEEANKVINESNNGKFIGTVSEAIKEFTEIIDDEEAIENLDNNITETKGDMSSETHSAITEDYKKEKATLINIYNKLVEVYDTDKWVYIPENISDDDLGHKMGITRDMYKTFFCKKSLDDFTSDIFLGVCAKEGKAEEVKNQLYKYKDKLTIEFESVPAQIDRIQAADVIQHGDYVYLILLGRLDKSLTGEQIHNKVHEDNALAVQIVSDDANYENIDLDIKEDKRYQLNYDVQYDIQIPDITSKPQNIVDETEESITPEENEQLKLEETQESSLSVK